MGAIIRALIEKKITIPPRPQQLSDNLNTPSRRFKLTAQRLSACQENVVWKKPPLRAPPRPGPSIELQRKQKITGTVKRTELYGAFIDVGLEADAIIHISQLGKKVNRVADVLTVGEQVEVFVEKVEPERGQLIVSMMEPLAVDWSDLEEGQVYTGTITRLENFGAFTDIGAEKEGLIHVSELSHEYVKHPSEVVKVGDEVQVRVLGHSRKKRRINLSMKALKEAPDAGPSKADMAAAMEEEEDFGEMPTAMEIALKRAMGEPVDMSPKRQRRGNKRQRRSKREQERYEEALNRTLELSK